MLAMTPNATGLPRYVRNDTECHEIAALRSQ